MHLYAPSNQVQNLRSEVIHTYIKTSILSGCKKEICICIKIRSLVITLDMRYTPTCVYAQI
jgi:hypothetical protein